MNVPSFLNSMNGPSPFFVFNCHLPMSLAGSILSSAASGEQSSRANAQPRVVRSIGNLLSLSGRKRVANNNLTPTQKPSGSFADHTQLPPQDQQPEFQHLRHRLVLVQESVVAIAQHCVLIHPPL